MMDENSIMASIALRRDNGAVRFFVRLGGLLVLAAAGLLPAQQVDAAISCTRTLVADVVAIDQPLMFNRLGAQNINGMLFALRQDVVDEQQKPLHKGGTAPAGGLSAVAATPVANALWASWRTCTPCTPG